MLKPEMEKALNAHINAEQYSAYLYLSMATYFDSVNLPGFANWMRIQVLEETAHADKFIAFVGERGGRVRLAPIDGPPTEWENPLALFENVYEHECHVSDLINKLVDLARSQSDHATENFLQWFVAEQVEEESSADEIVQQLKLIKGEGHGLFMIDREMATRVFTPPV